MKVAVISSSTLSLFRLRMDMIKEFIKNGHKVIALGPEPEEVWKDKFKKEGVEYRHIFVDRNGTNPFKDIKTIIELYKFLRREKPDKIFIYHAKTIIYGSIAAKLNGIEEVYVLIAGLGSIFRGTGIKNKIIKSIMKIQYWIACKCSKKVFFQNKDDKNEFIKNGLVGEEKTIIINGSGVNLEKFKPTDFPDKMAFLFIGRLIKDKGIIEYLEACRIVKHKYPQVRCILVGPFDSNPTALKPEELKPYIDERIIDYVGRQQDVRPYIAQSTVFVLPSYHEGTPNAVLESMAMGRPIITTDAPGCRETVIDGVNGFLIPIKDSIKLAEKMIWFIENREQIEKMGKESRKICEDKFDVNIVNEVILDTMKLYAVKFT